MAYSTKSFYKAQFGPLALSISRPGTPERVEKETFNICPDIEYFRGGDIYFDTVGGGVVVTRAKLPTRELPLISFAVYAKRKATYGV